MIWNKVLPNTRHVLSRRPLLFKTTEEVVRQRHTRAVPATTPLPLGEQLVLGVLVFASMWFVPYWVLYHIPDYQKEDRTKYTGK